RCGRRFRPSLEGGGAGSRRDLHRTRRRGWDSVAPLRVPWADVRERRAQAREAQNRPVGPAAEPKVSFISGGGFIVIGVAAIAGLIAFGPLLGAQAVTGGGLLPRDGSIRDLWSQGG